MSASVEIETAEEPDGESAGPLETSTSTEPVGGSGPDWVLLGVVAAAIVGTAVVVWGVQ